MTTKGNLLAGKYTFSYSKLRNTMNRTLSRGRRDWVCSEIMPLMLLPSNLRCKN